MSNPWQIVSGASLSLSQRINASSSLTLSGMQSLTLVPIPPSHPFLHILLHPIPYAYLYVHVSVTPLAHRSLFMPPSPFLPLSLPLPNNNLPPDIDSNLYFSLPLSFPYSFPSLLLSSSFPSRRHCASLGSDAILDLCCNFGCTLPNNSYSEVREHPLFSSHCALHRWI